MNSIDETTIDSVNNIQNTNYNTESGPDYDSSDDILVASVTSHTLQFEPKNTTLQIGNTKVGLLIVSGSVCSILNESLATEVIKYTTLAEWLTKVPPRGLKTFANEPIPLIGIMQTPVESNGWRIEDAKVVVVKDGLKPIIGRNLLEALGIAITLSLNSYEGSMINKINTQFPLNGRIANHFPQLITRNGRSKVHIVKSNFINTSNQNIKIVEEYLLICKI